jgi:DNA-binding response OmpR family regulator
VLHGSSFAFHLLILSKNRLLAVFAFILSLFSAILPNNYRLMPELKKILIAEDDEFLSSLLKNRLQRDGFAVQIARTGEETMAALKAIRPDLVLLDIILPGKLGFEILEDVQKDTKLVKIPFMVMSNLGQDDDIRKAKDLGALEYFVKSRILIDDLIKKISSFLGTQS